MIGSLSALAMFIIVVLLFEHASLRGYQKGSQNLEEIIDVTLLALEPEIVNTKVKKRDGTYHQIANPMAVARNNARRDMKGVL